MGRNNKLKKIKKEDDNVVAKVDTIDVIDNEDDDDDKGLTPEQLQKISLYHPDGRKKTIIEFLFKTKWKAFTFFLTLFIKFSNFNDPEYFKNILLNADENRIAF